MGSTDLKLKTKINLLLDKIDDLDRNLQTKKAQIQLIDEEIKMLQDEENYSGAQQIDFRQENEAKIVSFLRDFCIIASLILENEDYIKYSYETKNSGLFYKIEKGVFDDYICRYAKHDIKSFLSYCMDLMLVKSEKNRKCVYNSGEIQVYYVNKVFMNSAAQKDELQEA